MRRGYIRRGKRRSDSIRVPGGALRVVHRAETNLEPTDDLHMNDMRKERMVLKDQIAAALREEA